MKDGARNDVIEVEIFGLYLKERRCWEGEEKQLLPLVARERNELERVALAER